MPPVRETMLHTGVLLFLLCPVLYFFGERAAFYSFTCALVLTILSGPGYLLAFIVSRAGRK